MKLFDESVYRVVDIKASKMSDDRSVVIVYAVNIEDNADYAVFSSEGQDLSVGQELSQQELFNLINS